MDSETDGARPTVPRLVGNQWADAEPPGGGSNSCNCFAYSPESQPVSHAVQFHAERQDTSAPGWRHLVSLIEEAKADGRPDFRPFLELSPAERDQIVTLPAQIGELSQVRHLLLYGSPLRRLPVETAAMAGLEELTVYTSYRLHWFPYELSRCPNLRKSTVSTRAVYGNAHFRPPFPALTCVTDISGLDLNDLDPGRFGASSATLCSVCQGPIAGRLWQRWITLRIATDALPMLVSACSEACIRDLPPPLPGFIDHPHQGGELQQPPALHLR
jgi:hypothetical protein